MAANNGVPLTGPQLIAQANLLGQNLTMSNVLRWAIGELNKGSAGLTPNAAPATLSAISSDLSLTQQQDAEVYLWAILLQFFVGQLGGGSGLSELRTGTVAPNGNVFGNVGDQYNQTGAGSGSIWLKNSGQGTNTGWVQKA